MLKRREEDMKKNLKMDHKNLVGMIYSHIFRHIF